MGGEGRRDAGHGQGAIPQLLRGDGRHQGAVHAAGVGHYHGGIASQVGTEPGQGVLQLWGKGFNGAMHGPHRAERGTAGPMTLVRIQR